jgi:hypothetical protein
MSYSTTQGGRVRKFGHTDLQGNPCAGQRLNLRCATPVEQNKRHDRGSVADHVDQRHASGRDAAGFIQVVD